MVDTTHAQARILREALPESRAHQSPPLTNAEREFWRRAVAIERARQDCGRPAPFPFQES